MNERPDMTPPCNWVQSAGAWRETVADAIRRLQDDAASTRIRFVVRHDFAELTARRTALGLGLNARWDPRFSRQDPAWSVWIHGLDGDGETASFGAVRVHDWHGGRTLATEARTMRWYFDRPELDALPAEHAHQLPPIADRIQGRVATTGALWVRPDLRGPRPELGQAHLSQIVSALNRLVAAGGYDPGWLVATTPERHFVHGMPDRYGWPHVEAKSFHESIAAGTGPGPVHLMWARREEALAEAIAIRRDGVPAPA